MRTRYDNGTRRAAARDPDPDPRLPRRRDHLRPDRARPGRDASTARSRCGRWTGARTSSRTASARATRSRARSSRTAPRSPPLPHLLDLRGRAVLLPRPRRRADRRLPRPRRSRRRPRRRPRSAGPARRRLRRLAPARSCSRRTTCASWRTGASTPTSATGSCWSRRRARSSATTGVVLLGGHSQGTTWASTFAAYDFDPDPSGVEAGYSLIDGLLLLEGGGVGPGSATKPTLAQYQSDGDVARRRGRAGGVPVELQRHPAPGARHLGRGVGRRGLLPAGRAGADPAHADLRHRAGRRAAHRALHQPRARRSLPRRRLLADRRLPRVARLQRQRPQHADQPGSRLRALLPGGCGARRRAGAPGRSSTTRRCRPARRTPRTSAPAARCSTTARRRILPIRPSRRASTARGRGHQPDRLLPDAVRQGQRLRVVLRRPGRPNLDFGYGNDSSALVARVAGGRTRRTRARW